MSLILYPHVPHFLGPLGFEGSRWGPKKTREEIWVVCLIHLSFLQKRVSGRLGFGMQCHTRPV